MKAVEEYIKEHTNKYSNHVELAANITGFTPWLTVDDARKVAEIARKETIKDVCEVINIFVDDLKKYLNDKL
jgi:glutamate/tyrosine decarboxylase-like PLP-dependent enzyme